LIDADLIAFPGDRSDNEGVFRLGLVPLDEADAGRGGHDRGRVVEDGAGVLYELHAKHHHPGAVAVRDREADPLVDADTLPAGRESQPRRERDRAVLGHEQTQPVPDLPDPDHRAEVRHRVVHGSLRVLQVLRGDPEAIDEASPLPVRHHVPPSSTKGSSRAGSV
jgi:hypothetical protein